MTTISINTRDTMVPQHAYLTPSHATEVHLDPTIVIYELTECSSSKLQ